ncbi:recombinase family protein [Clostridium perfringens]|uniref:recombinase family protein n=1 Tax=Clostridium perfringens TaxID=1502 RepID=UPI000E12CE9B|nr:recombinase family protein [Clostridium perfringens]MDH5064026.1 Recombinase [Clostridium perfringens]UBK37508.1 recombinase family protein [Clostridium perfringens]UBK97092.1 recombinase family protein [Clostridium perfringens]SUY43053.1 resolvase site-specific recombinase [Clostridium perfringens]
MNNLQLKESSISDMNSLPKNIAIYTRVSTEKQDSNNSKANQLESIKQYINNQGWSDVPYEIYSDTQSASITSNSLNMYNDSDTMNPSIFLRDGLRRLIYDANYKKFDKLIVYSHDRLSRDIYEGLLIKHTLKKLNIDILYSKAGEQINSENQSINNFFENMLSNIAALESSIIGGRVLIGNRHNILNNIWAGGPAPYGYKLIALPSNRKKSKLSIYAPEARVVKKIFELYTTGYTPKDIVQFIKSEYSYNKDRLWTINSIKSILNNPVYTGTMVWNKKGGKRNPRKHPIDEYVYSKFDENIRIIDEKLWKKSLNIRKLQDENPKFLSTAFLLQGMLVCKSCGNYLTSKNHGNSSGRVYFCSHNNKDKFSKKINAPTITMKASLIHNIVFKELLNLYKSILSIPAFFDEFYSNYLNKLKEKNNNLLVQKDEIESNINHCDDILMKCSSEISRLLELTNVMSKDIADIDYHEKNLLLLDSIKEFKTSLILSKSQLNDDLNKINRKLSKSIPSKACFKDYVVNTLNPIEDILSQENSKIKNRCLRLLLHEIIDKIIISETFEIKIIFK